MLTWVNHNRGTHLSGPGLGRSWKARLAGNGCKEAGAIAAYSRHLTRLPAGAQPWRPAHPGCIMTLGSFTVAQAAS